MFYLSDEDLPDDDLPEIADSVCKLDDDKKAKRLARITKLKVIQ